MRVYNLSKLPVDFHGHTISPDGGSAEYPELDKYLSSRDKKLEEQKILSFGCLPMWWQLERTMAVPVIEVPDVIVGKQVEPVVKEITPPPLPVSTDWIEKPLGKKKLKG